MIDLTTCVKGQKLRLRNGRLAKYCELRESSCTYPHLIAHYDDGHTYTYTNSGTYGCGNNYEDLIDVVEILPLETTKFAPHPSVAWWNSCPWITYRKPTKEDADKFDRVLVIAEPDKILTASFKHVSIGEAWIHHGGWQPPALTDREQALQLLDDHQDGWSPSPEQWLVIRKGLEAS
jgi:hypothetical protein